MVTADSPVIETTRAGGARPHRPGRRSRACRTTAATSSTSRSSPPASRIVQGPDGDELTINGQKGIYNNISVDGADFNNPFFGEQRGGQRPAFTFNLDAVQEVVVVADGRQRRVRPLATAASSTWSPSRAPTRCTARCTPTSRTTRSPRAPKQADGSEADKFDFSQQQFGFTLGGPIVKDKAFYFVALDYQNGELDQADRPVAHRAAGGRLLREPRQPQRERPDRAHQRRPRVPGQDRLAAQPEAPADAALQLHLVRAEERHLRRRLLGRERQRRSRRTTRTRSPAR